MGEAGGSQPHTQTLLFIAQPNLVEVEVYLGLSFVSTFCSQVVWLSGGWNIMITQSQLKLKLSGADMRIVAGNIFTGRKDSKWWDCHKTNNPKPKMLLHVMHPQYMCLTPNLKD